MRSVLYLRPPGQAHFNESWSPGFLYGRLIQLSQLHLGATNEIISYTWKYDQLQITSWSHYVMAIYFHKPLSIAELNLLASLYYSFLSSCSVAAQMLGIGWTLCLCTSKPFPSECEMTVYLDYPKFLDRVRSNEHFLPPVRYDTTSSLNKRSL